MSEACPDENELTSLVEGRLGGASLAHLEAHVDRCVACSALLAELAAVLSPSDSTPPPKPDRYRLLGELGSGAQGVVYEAYDRQLGRRVALKRVRPDLALKSPALVADARLRLEREARTLAGLSHPNVVALFDVQAEGDELVLVQELVDGDPLDVWLRDHRQPQRSILDVFAQAATGLHAAHVAGVVHRDVKPSNLLVGKDGRVRVTDFGLARAGELDASLTQTGAAVGTPAYMAPEQLTGKPADARSDQYSLAVSLAEAITGERPLPNATSVHLEESRSAHGLAPCAHELLEAIATALSARPSDRFMDMATFAGRLRTNASTGSSSSAGSDSKVTDARTLRPPPVGASPPLGLPRVAGVTVLLGILGLSGYAAFGRGGEPELDGRRDSLVAVPAATTSSSHHAPSSTTTASTRTDASQHAGGGGSPRAASFAASNTSAGPSSTDPADLLAAARRARPSDPSACVTHHQSIARADAAFAAQPAIQRERAECEMLAGQCDVGRQRMRGLLSGDYTGEALENALEALTQGSCKGGARRSATSSAAVSVDDARELVAASHEAWKKADVARCRTVGDRATSLAQPGQPIEVSSQLASAIGMANDCLAKNGDCASARRNFVAQYPKLYPQLVAGGVDQAQRETMFKASFPNCATPSGP